MGDGFIWLMTETITDLVKTAIDDDYSETINFPEDGCLL
jgi:hypothetical protein